VESAAAAVTRTTSRPSVDSEPALRARIACARIVCVCVCARIVCVCLCVCGGGAHFV
jgi:hypothetical protein